VIDWERVADIRAEVGEDGFAEIISLFLDETDVVIARLAAGSADLDADLHFLKGSALNLGFHQLALRCQQTERRGGGAQAAPDLPGLVSLYHESKAEFLVAMARLTAA